MKKLNRILAMFIAGATLLFSSQTASAASHQKIKHQHHVHIAHHVKKTIPLHQSVKKPEQMQQAPPRISRPSTYGAVATTIVTKATQGQGPSHPYLLSVKNHAPQPGLWESFRNSLGAETIKIGQSVSASGIALSSTFGYRDGHWAFLAIRCGRRHGHQARSQKAVRRVWVAEDNGVGSPLLNPECSCVGIDTNRRDVPGVSFPANTYCKVFHLPPIPPHFNYEYWKKWQVVRDSAVLLDDGVRKVIHPTVDIGPGPSGQAHGYNMDATYLTYHELNGARKWKYTFLKGYYLTHPRPPELHTAGTQRKFSNFASASTKAKEAPQRVLLARNSR
jgi:hypothetical protein